MQMDDDFDSPSTSTLPPSDSTDDGVTSQELPVSEPNYYQPPEIYAVPCGFDDMNNWKSRSNQSLKIIPCDFSKIPGDEQESRPLASTRHSTHYFSNLNLFSDIGYNYLKYAKYSELKAEHRKHPPMLNLIRTTFTLDSRSNLDRACLRLPQRVPVIREVSLDLAAGDIMALLYTSDYEMRSLLRVISGRASAGKVGGEILLNGSRQSKEQLRNRIALVRNDDLTSPLTVEQYLKIRSGLRPPPKMRQPKIRALLASLALSRLKNKFCTKLGKTEKQRVKLAAELMCDTDILLCENITDGMDVFDVGFIIDYLRNWALRLNRIVILALAPSSIEMLQMFSKVLILASGRVTYFGPPDEMIPHFESINFPCPLFKNPCDYYVDLATHDHLSEDASRESLRRISALSGQWAQKERVPPPLHPSAPPPIAGKAGVFKSFTLVYRIFLFDAINHLMRFLKEPLSCLLISIVISAIFPHFPGNHRNSADDRLGLVYAMMYFAYFPLIFIWSAIAINRKQIYATDRKTGLYGSFLYCFAQILFDLPIVFISSSCLHLPILFLTEFTKTSSSDLFFIISFMVPLTLHYVLMRSMVFTVSHFFSDKSTSVNVSVFLLSLLIIVSGLPVSLNDSPEISKTIANFSLGFWIAQAVLQQQFIGISIAEKILSDSSKTIDLLISCEKRQILATKIGDIPIYGVTHCSKFGGSQVLSFFGYDSSPPNNTSIMLSLLVIASWFLVVLMLFCGAARRRSVT